MTALAQDAPSGLLCNLLSHPENSLITDPHPDFGWIMNSPGTNELQSACQILVASSPEGLARDQGDLWNSGKIISSESINVPHGGTALAPLTSYWWKVRTWNRENQPSPYSQPQRFNTGEFQRLRAWPGESRSVQIPDGSGNKLWTFEDRAPTTYHPFAPADIILNPDGSSFLDFGRAAFAALDLTLTWQPRQSSETSCVVNIEVGEKNRGHAVDNKPGGGITVDLERSRDIRETGFGLVYDFRRGYSGQG